MIMQARGTQRTIRPGGVACVILASGDQKMARVLVILALLGSCLAQQARAQEPSEQPITRFVVDLRGALPKVPGNDDLAAPYGLAGTNLPGLGVGVDVGAHIYPCLLYTSDAADE